MVYKGFHYVKEGSKSVLEELSLQIKPGFYSWGLTTKCCFDSK